jgi:hypothetical protein
MHNRWSEKKTLDPNNQFQIQCPIFKATTRIAGCIMLRDKFWRGDPHEGRCGCKAALQANKCPIPHIFTKMLRDDGDPYHSPLPKVGSLEPEILNRIGPVLVPTDVMDKQGVTGRERELLLEANENTGKYAKSFVKPRRKPIAAATPAAAASPTQTAAETGDMSAALNKEIKEESDAADQS